MSDKLSHLSKTGTPSMVNVSGKQPSLRVATARAIVIVPDNLKEHLNQGDIYVPKGPVFQTASLAGVMAAKKTGDLIPLCHPIGLDDCQVNIKMEGNEIIIDTESVVFSKTGVEMEALTAASVAALTVYDMCKALSHDIVISEIKLMSKKGGKSDFKREK